VFDGYRKTYLETHGKPAGEDKLAYLCVVSVAHDRKTAFERAEKMRGYFSTAARLDPQFRNPAGFSSVKDNVRMIQAGPNAIRPRLRDGTPLPSEPTVEQYIDAGLMFVGTPDEVYAQLQRFYSDVGGFGNLLMMGQAGTLNHEETVDNLTIFAKEVMPRLKDLKLDMPDVKYEAFA
jgi:alkanesulfonate monooxygenase SsuD/methylene tetrahydromethanopterin reductase-like flavin-dependent oxidoreductase (luciferase family)